MYCYCLNQIRNNTGYVYSSCLVCWKLYQTHTYYVCLHDQNWIKSHTEELFSLCLGGRFSGVLKRPFSVTLFVQLCFWVLLLGWDRGESDCNGYHREQLVFERSEHGRTVFETVWGARPSKRALREGLQSLAGGRIMSWQLWKQVSLEFQRSRGPRFFFGFSQLHFGGCF